MADGFGKKGTVKVSRRDLAYVTGLVRLLFSSNFGAGGGADRFVVDV